MAHTASKPTFTFFKMIGCGACNQFQREIFDRLVKDPEILQAVNVDEVIFGRDEHGNVYDLLEDYPDFASKVRYAPFLWLSQPYDEMTGYHLRPETMNNPTMNLRLNGQEFSYRRDTTYEGLKKWILTNAGQYRSFRKAGGSRKKLN